MKLVWKLSFTLIGAMCLLFSVHVFTSASAQLKLFQADKENDGRLLGHISAAAISSEFERGGVAAAKRLTAEIDARDTDVQTRWVDFSATDSSLRPVSDVRLEELHRAGQITRVAHDSEGREAILTYTTLRSPAPQNVAIEISQSLSDKEAFVVHTVVRAGISLLLMLLASTIISLLASAYWVGRPVDKLLEKAQAISAGDFLTKLELSQHDEFRTLGVALVEAGEELERREIQVEREHEERLKAEAQLRHAERLATVGKLASGVAHEVGTPLNVVSGHAGLIVGNDSAPDPCRESARVIKRQTDRISRIIRGLLDFARQGRSQHRRNDVVDLVGLSRSTISLVESLEISNGVEVELSADSELLQTRGDSSQLQQVLMNLLVNGLQALDGEGRIAVELDICRSKAPGIESAVEGEYVRVAIADDGPGIAERDLPHLFEPFYTTKDVGEGTGLGLAVVYGIVQEHEGWINVISQQGDGSRFEVYLPKHG